jgi:hypothetical protein
VGTGDAALGCTITCTEDLTEREINAELNKYLPLSWIIEPERGYDIFYYMRDANGNPATSFDYNTKHGSGLWPNHFQYVGKYTFKRTCTHNVEGGNVYEHTYPTPTVVSNCIVHEFDFAKHITVTV